MSESASKWKLGGGAIVLVLISVPLWREFYEPGHMGWNVFLTFLLGGLIAAAFKLQSFLRNHIDEVGEARFDTRNQSERND